MPQRNTNRNHRRSRYTLGPAGGLLVLVLLFFLSSRFNLGPAPEGVESVPLPEDGGAEPLQVYFLDVGQGDSQLVRIPGEAGYFNVLIDTGEYQYADGLTAYLESLGVSRIDALIASHPHTDHMGCMNRVIERFDIGGIYMPQMPEDKTPTSVGYEKLLDAASAKGLTVSPLHEGSAIESPAGSQFQVMSPQVDADWEGANNYSAVIRLVYGGTAFLFTGDAEQESEEIILEAGYHLDSDVLKMGHHGSSTSTSAAFFQAVSPEYAVISCGQDNRYGHPHRETLAMLNQRKTTYYRTDQDGTILAQSDGETIAFTTGLDSVLDRDAYQAAQTKRTESGGLSVLLVCAAAGLSSGTNSCPVE